MKARSENVLIQTRSGNQSQNHRQNLAPHQLRAHKMLPDPLVLLDLAAVAKALLDQPMRNLIMKLVKTKDG